MKKAGITAAQKAKKGLSRVLMVLGGITLAFFLLIIAVSFMDSGSSDKKHEETKVTTAAEKSRPAQTTTAKETETETEAETMEIAEEVEDWEEGEYGFYKLLEDDTYRFMLYNPFSDLGSRISLPGTFNNKPVTEIATMAFAYSDFEQIRLPYGIRSIGENAFDGCPNLEAVFIPSSVEEIPQPLVEDCPNESYFIFVTGLTETEVQELVDEGSWCEDWQGATDWVVYFGLSDVTDELPSNSWQKLNDGTWLYFDAGYVPITEWLDIMGKTYFFDETGAALSGWLEGLKYTYYFDLEDCFLCKGWTEVEGKNYYFDLEDGHMLTNMATPDGYWVDENGVWTETGYILPYSDSRKLSDEQVSLMDHDQLQLAINEIYARHGKIFTQQENQAYFKGKDWYRPSSSFSESMLSDIEKDNVKVLSKYRDLKN